MVTNDNVLIKKKRGVFIPFTVERFHSNIGKSAVGDTWLLQILLLQYLPSLNWKSTRSSYRCHSDVNYVHHNCIHGLVLERFDY